MTSTLILDSGGGNPYTHAVTLAARSAGIDAALCGTRQTPGVDHVVYPDAGMRGRKLTKIAVGLHGLFALATTVRRRRPSVVHFQWTGPFDVAYAFAFRLLGIPIVFTVHNPGARAENAARRHAYLVKQASRLVVHGPTLARELERDRRVDARKVDVVPHPNFSHVLTGIDRAAARQAFGLTAEDVVFAFIGAVTPRKGLETLLAAFDEYRASGRSGRLLIVGTSADRSYTAALAARIETFGDAIVWRVDDDLQDAWTIEAALVASDQVVLPFVEATQSSSVIYAMSVGRCVVTSRLGELPDTVGGGGIVVRPDDVAGFAEAMCVAADDPGACTRYGLAAAARAAADLSPEAVGALMRGVYADACASGVDLAARPASVEGEA